nr:MAG TPA: hypothetical protein [Bacteriophage sp.]
MAHLRQVLCRNYTLFAMKQCQHFNKNITG